MNTQVVSQTKYPREPIGCVVHQYGSNNRHRLCYASNPNEPINKEGEWAGYEHIAILDIGFAKFGATTEYYDTVLPRVFHYSEMMENKRS